MFPASPAQSKTALATLVNLGFVKSAAREWSGEGVGVGGGVGVGVGVGVEQSGAERSGVRSAGGGVGWSDAV